MQGGGGVLLAPNLQHDSIHGEGGPVLHHHAMGGCKQSQGRAARGSARGGWVVARGGCGASAAKEHRRFWLLAEASTPAGAAERGARWGAPPECTELGWQRCRPSNCPTAGPSPSPVSTASGAIKAPPQRCCTNTWPVVLSCMYVFMSTIQSKTPGGATLPRKMSAETSRERAGSVMGPALPASSCSTRPAGRQARWEQPGCETDGEKAARLVQRLGRADGQAPALAAHHRPLTIGCGTIRLVFAHLQWPGGPREAARPPAARAGRSCVTTPENAPRRLRAPFPTPNDCY